MLTSDPFTDGGPGGPTHRGPGPQDHYPDSGPGPVRDRDDLPEYGITRARYADVAGLLAGTIPGPPEPAFGARTDGHRLFYAGQVNLIFGDPESGKTWVSLAAAAEALTAGQKVLVVDLDHNGVASIAARLVALGVDPDMLGTLDRFRYIEPEDRSDVYNVVDDCADWAPDLVVVDSLGELLPLFGSSSNSADDFTVVHTAVLKKMAMAGAAVLLIDHLAKGSESRTFGPGGTGAKRRAIGGTSIRVRVKDAFTPGSGGAAYLTVNKDRHGGLRQHCPTGDREPLAGVFHLRSYTGGVLMAETVPPAEGESAPSDFGIGANPERVAADVDALAALDPPPTSKRDVQQRMKWGSDRAVVALDEYRRRHENP
ncbi:AAA family ATPase [Dietzia sp. SLG310A2-38A2]|uniref:AAA family ATPase n=1 Tax=Dietzia sp. SLG310A2-38A2 TaxID=1630643 RepID=UPI0015FC9998|nr:AAA family ATPase [Dietzia sp. SLG310A2-38A2]MBB1032560.1 AAA family ATPase [Dietzia sp. SLG310A2-38A2]